MKAYLSLGSNLGNRRAYLQQAVEKLNSLAELEVTAISSILETEPYGNTDQGMFLNQVVEIETSLSAEGLLDCCSNIEKHLHRERIVRWGPRTIDIDILLYGAMVINEPELSIPHNDMENRVFVLQPLAEIAGEVIHPVSGKSIDELYKKLLERMK